MCKTASLLALYWIMRGFSFYQRVVTLHARAAASTALPANAVLMRVYGVLVFRLFCRLACDAALKVSRFASVRIWRHWPRPVRVSVNRGS